MPKAAMLSLSTHSPFAQDQTNPRGSAALNFPRRPLSPEMAEQGDIGDYLPLPTTAGNASPGGVPDPPVPGRSPPKQLGMIQKDPFLQPYAAHLRTQMRHTEAYRERIIGSADSLRDFANGHLYFGLQQSYEGWILREWAPNATGVCLVGDCNGWRTDEGYQFELVDDGVWELRLPPNRLQHGSAFRLAVSWPGGSGMRLPAYCTRAVQNSVSGFFDAQIWDPPKSYVWQSKQVDLRSKTLAIYEAHIGMAQESESVGSYTTFREHILPRVKAGGYNAIQLMAIAEHPYYGSFGYHVSNYFAPSSRFGTPEELKGLIDSAHAMGIGIIFDVVYAHCVKNPDDGLACLDGSDYQYCHGGERGTHKTWGSRVFDYGKPQVAHLLLSNLKYWCEEYHVDGFRFDGVTSMLYLDHGEGRSFMDYGAYFGDHVDRDALALLTLANELVHELNPGAITIAEDVSGYPGLAQDIGDGGVGFDYRLAMGIPDFWVKQVRDRSHEAWHPGEIFYELTNRRQGEGTLSYVECHDQAMVGDQTLIFRLLGTKMYTQMRLDQADAHIQRAMSTHCLIRLLTVFTAQGGYLSFMGNEAGHPEWIDFPRQGNDWSYRHARRLWSVMDDSTLQYHRLAAFDRALLSLTMGTELFAADCAYKLYEHTEPHILVFRRGDYVVVAHLGVDDEPQTVVVPVGAGSYEVVLNTDDAAYGGSERGRGLSGRAGILDVGGGRSHALRGLMSARSAVVLRRVESCDSTEDVASESLRVSHKRTRDDSLSGSDEPVATTRQVVARICSDSGSVDLQEGSA